MQTCEILAGANATNVVAQWDDAHRYTPAPRHRRRLILDLLAGLDFADCLDAGCAQPFLLWVPEEAGTACRVSVLPNDTAVRGPHPASASSAAFALAAPEPAHAGGTDLEIREINSAFAFLVFGGLGASFFISDKTAVYAGYRWQHVSNANTSQPNRGFEAHVMVGGISFYFP